jgi:AraC-like DNA-binding protein
MFRSKKTLIKRLGSELKIAAILFLFVLAWFAAAAGASRKTVAKHKGSLFSVSLKTDSAKTVKPAPSRTKIPVSGRDTAVAKKTAKANADSVHQTVAAHSANSALPKNGPICVDTGSLPLSLGQLDSAHKAPAPGSDTGHGSAVAAVRPADSVVSIAAVIKPAIRPVPVRVPAARGRIGALLARIAIILFSILVIVVAVVFAAKLRRRMGGQRFLTTTRLSVMDKEVQRACRYIELHFAESDCNPKVVCEALTTGERFLEVLMERNLGIGVGEFITHVRINGARRMLEKDPAVPKETLARASGFTDIHLFEEAFLKAAGLSFNAFAKR